MGQLPSEKKSQYLLQIAKDENRYCNRVLNASIHPIDVVANLNTISHSITVCLENNFED